jgi:hypothetical protein
MDGFELSFDDGEINARLIGLAQREASSGTSILPRFTWALDPRCIPHSCTPRGSYDIGLLPWCHELSRIQRRCKQQSAYRLGYEIHSSR